ncbi:MAG: metallophosphoesterase [Gammaproteobacteria bacterium]|nr:metallophosphoesterase [Gammaproteobacteria bacterium]
MFADADGELRGTVTADSLQRVLDHYDAGDWRADRAWITGDLIQDDSSEAYQRFHDFLLPLNMRMHCIPGNHDIRGLMRPVCSRPPFSYCAKEQVNDWLMIGLDSCISDDAGGELSPAELERVDAAIGETSAKHVMVCLHHPPIPMGSKWLDTVGLRNGEEFLTQLQKLQKVRLVVFGHVHQAYDAEHNGMQIIGTPSTCSQFKPGSDDFAVDVRPPAYRRITLNPDGSFEAELVWVEDTE